MLDRFFAAAWPAGVPGWQLLLVSSSVDAIHDCLDQWLWLQGPGSAGSVLRGPFDCDEAVLRTALRLLIKPTAPGYERAIERFSDRVCSQSRLVSFFHAYASSEVLFDV